MERCERHPGELAGWRCDACGRGLCPKCTAWKQAGHTRLEACVPCGGFARPILVHRGELQPFNLRALADALRWPFTRTGLLTIFASALLVTLFGLLGAKARFIAGGVLIAYLFQIVRHTALGHDDFPAPEDFRGYREDIVAPSFRLALALAWLWLPAALLSWHNRADLSREQERAVQQALAPGGQGLQMRGVKVVRSATGGVEVIEQDAQPPPASPEQLAQMQAAEPEEPVDPPKPPSWPLWRVLLVVLGIAIAPMSLLASALQTPLSVAMNPIALAGHAIRLGRDYLLVVVFCAAGVGAELALRALMQGTLLRLPLGSLPANFVLLLLPFGLFRGIGLFVRARGSDMGYGGEEAYLVRVLGDAQPAGEPPAAPEPKPIAPRIAARELELPEESAPVADPVQEFVRLVAAGDHDAALAQLETAAPPAQALSAQTWMELGKVAVQRKRAKPAIRALRRCLEIAPQGPLAPQAWLLAARVYDEGLRDRKTSDKLLAELARRFPESPEGKFAAARLRG
jgi:hypothetical protein